MAWLAGIVVLILLVVFPGFRKFVGVLIAIAAVMGGIYYLQDEHEKKLSLSRIRVSETTLEDMELKKEYGSYHITGRIKNNSEMYTLRELVLTVTMRDCSGEARPENCITIGESNPRTYLTIPPGQARDFEMGVYFPGDGPHPKNRGVWDYSISEIRAE